MAEKVTIMVLKVVDLQCPGCYKEVKKILCKFPQIRDQIYDKKANKVTISVVCCNPEKFRDKLCCKGCEVIKSIEIKEPPKPKPPQKPIETEKPPPPPAEPPAEPPAQPPAPAPPPPLMPGPCIVDGRPPNYPGPVRTCCRECYEGYGGGPCYHGYGVPPPPPPCYDGYYWYGYGPRKICYVSRCDYYLSEENPHSCSIM